MPARAPARPPAADSPGGRLRRLIESIPEDRRPSQAEIARRSGMSPAGLSDILNGHRPNPGILTVRRVLDAIGRTLADYDAVATRRTG